MQGGGLSEFIMKPGWQAKQIIRSHIWSAFDDIGMGTGTGTGTGTFGSAWLLINNKLNKQEQIAMIKTNSYSAVIINLY